MQLPTTVPENWAFSHIFLAFVVHRNKFLVLFVQVFHLPMPANEQRWTTLTNFSSHTKETHIFLELRVLLQLKHQVVSQSFGGRQTRSDAEIHHFQRFRFQGRHLRQVGRGISKFSMKSYASHHIAYCLVGFFLLLLNLSNTSTSP